MAINAALSKHRYRRVLVFAAKNGVTLNGPRRAAQRSAGRGVCRALPMLRDRVSPLRAASAAFRGGVQATSKVSNKKGHEHLRANAALQAFQGSTLPKALNVTVLDIF